MHEALEQVLKTKDLAKAGDLFSIPDDGIAEDCSRFVIDDSWNTDGKIPILVYSSCIITIFPTSILHSCYCLYEFFVRYTCQLARLSDLYTSSSALLLIGTIIAQPDYLNVDGIQSVVEICVTRITSAVRYHNSMFTCH